MFGDSAANSKLATGGFRQAMAKEKAGKKAKKAGKSSTPKPQAAAAKAEAKKGEKTHTQAAPVPVRTRVLCCVHVAA